MASPVTSALFPKEDHVEQPGALLRVWLRALPQRLAAPKEEEEHEHRHKQHGKLVSVVPVQLTRHPAEHPHRARDLAQRSSLQTPDSFHRNLYEKLVL